jgi:hypothetical protein
MKKCQICGHTRAAHVESRCALCGCNSERKSFTIQESLSFRSSIHVSPPKSRKG